ncbi:MAG: hypothetical protein DRQ62_02690 [Gammaproteobacteria bacterium]|nr:MAG: hypothetical protein DRQ62_02690 [Gammaproteobacteria bacterium]
MDAFSMVAIVFLVWAISPYLFAMLIIKQCIQHKQLMIVAGLSSILAIAGTWLLIDMMYIQPDAQSALALVVIPMYQWLVLLVIAVLNYIFNRKH